MLVSSGRTRFGSKGTERLDAEEMRRADLLLPVLSQSGTGIKKFIAADSSDDSSSESDSDSDSSSESEPAPPPKKLKSSSRVEPSSTAVVSAPSTSSSKKASTNNNDMDFVPATVLRVPRSAAAPPPATQISNVVDRKGKGREVIELLSSSDMEDSPPPPDIEEVAGMDRMSIEPTRKSKTPAPLPPSKKVINNDSSSDDDSSDSDESDAGHLTAPRPSQNLPRPEPLKPAHLPSSFTPAKITKTGKQAGTSDPTQKHAPIPILRPGQQSTLPKKPIKRPKPPAPPDFHSDPRLQLNVPSPSIWQQDSVAEFSSWIQALCRDRTRVHGTNLVNQMAWCEIQLRHVYDIIDLIRTSPDFPAYMAAMKTLQLAYRGYAAQPLPCPTCSRPFKNEWNLLRHQTIHDAGRVPQDCGHCSFVFTRRVTLIEHEATSHGVVRIPTRCSACPRVLESAQACQDHEEKHAISAGRSCTVCYEVYFRRDGLAAHLRKSHGILLSI
ncbi:hypothetical protein BDY24DRAFT_241582 [Mrakia frigida]|uniref:uncharacterized protein n=1 Tax=Mrakia frigida TaxID=29902 RepID=UPI003FCC1096